MVFVIFLLILRLFIFESNEAIIICSDADWVGAIANWAMVVVTSVTAYFIYKTLDTQRQQLESQEKSIRKQDEKQTKQIEIMEKANKYYSAQNQRDTMYRLIDELQKNINNVSISYKLDETRYPIKTDDVIKGFMAFEIGFDIFISYPNCYYAEMFNGIAHAYNTYIDTLKYFDYIAKNNNKEHASYIAIISSSVSTQAIIAFMYIAVHQNQIEEITVLEKYNTFNISKYQGQKFFEFIINSIVSYYEINFENKKYDAIPFKEVRIIDSKYKIPCMSFLCKLNIIEALKRHKPKEKKIRLYKI